MTSADQIRRVLMRQPFRPFDLKMVDGTVYTVPGIEWLSIPPAEFRPQEVAYYVKPEPGKGGEFENYEVHWLDLHQIIEVIESRVSAARSEGNGS
jgi:hypothetical protein